MYKRNKYNYEFRLRCVKAVLQKGQSVSEVANEKGIDRANLRLWLGFYAKCKLPLFSGHSKLEF